MDSQPAVSLFSAALRNHLNATPQTSLPLNWEVQLEAALQQAISLVAEIICQQNVPSVVLFQDTENARIFDEVLAMYFPWVMTIPNFDALLKGSILEHIPDSIKEVDKGRLAKDADNDLVLSWAEMGPYPSLLSGSNKNTNTPWKKATPL